MGESVEENQEIYSYHTFIMPFRWEGEKHNQSSIKDVCDAINHRGCWTEEIYDEGHLEDTLKKINRTKNLYYASRQYFHQFAQEAIFGNSTRTSEDSTVEGYIFSPKGKKRDEKWKATYTITKTWKEGETDRYQLNINAIRLKVYNTGIALLIIECENTQSKDLKDIKAINDFGRRMTLPFIPGREEWWRTICADSIEITMDMDGKTLILGKSDFKREIEEFYSNDEENHIIRTKMIGNHILQLLNFHCHSETLNEKFVDEVVGDSEAEDEKHIMIYPVLDDRMYVLSVIPKNADEVFNIDCSKYPEWIANIIQEQEAKDDIEKNFRNSLYEYLFIDCDGCISCPTPLMRDELLRKHLYTRWSEYGTLYGITAHSFVSTTGDTPTINNVLTMYLEMCCLVLAQRASLLNLKDEAAKLSMGLEKRKTKIRSKTIRKLMDLQERYVAFQNQVNHYEISSQEQAIDIYQYLREAEFVEKSDEILKNQLDSLYNAANVNMDYKLTIGGLIFAIGAGILTIPSFYADLLPKTWRGFENLCFFNRPVMLTIVLILLGALGCWFYRKLIK